MAIRYESGRRYRPAPGRGGDRPRLWWGWRLLLGASLGLGTLIGGYVLYAFLVPPFGPDPLAERPSIARLPDDQNAWVEFAKALRCLPEKPPDWTRRIEDLDAISSQQREELAAAREVVQFVMRATRRPGWQTTTEPGTAYSESLSLKAMREALAYAAAHARLAELSGRADQALEAKASLYRLASNVAEPHQGLMPVLVATSMRVGLQRQLMLSSVGEEASVAALLRAAHDVELADAAYPTPAQVEHWDFAYFERTWEDVCIRLRSTSGEGEEPITWAAFPRAARRRFYRGIMHESRAIADAVRPAWEQWDFRALAAADETRASRLGVGWARLRRPFLGEILGARMLALSLSYRFGDMLGLLYRDRTGGAAARVMLIAAAYAKRHGAYPNSLETAFAEFGLTPPKDPATGQVPGYRVDGGEVVVWFAGPDGEDDGGLIEAKAGRLVIQAGTDVIYRPRASS